MFLLQTTEVIFYFDMLCLSSVSYVLRNHFFQRKYLTPTSAVTALATLLRHSVSALKSQRTTNSSVLVSVLEVIVRLLEDGARRAFQSVLSIVLFLPIL